MPWDILSITEAWDVKQQELGLFGHFYFSLVFMIPLYWFYVAAIWPCDAFIKLPAAPASWAADIFYFLLLYYYFYHLSPVRGLEVWGLSRTIPAPKLNDSAIVCSCYLWLDEYLTHPWLSPLGRQPGDTHALGLMCDIGMRTSKVLGPSNIILGTRIIVQPWASPQERGWNWVYNLCFDDRTWQAILKGAVDTSVLLALTLFSREEEPAMKPFYVSSHSSLSLLWDEHAAVSHIYLALVSQEHTHHADLF